MHSHHQYDIFEECSAAFPVVKGNIDTAQQREHRQKREKREGPNACAITSARVRLCVSANLLSPFTTDTRPGNHRPSSHLARTREPTTTPQDCPPSLTAELVFTQEVPASGSSSSGGTFLRLPLPCAHIRGRAGGSQHYTGTGGEQTQAWLSQTGQHLWSLSTALLWDTSSTTGRRSTSGLSRDGLAVGLGGGVQSQLVCGNG